MLPENALSSRPEPKAFLLPPRVEPTSSNSFGGTDIGQISDVVFVWSGTARGNKAVISNGLVTHEILDLTEEITNFDFGFTQNMSLVVSWETASGAFIRYYDSVSHDDKTVKLDRCKNICVNLDDPRDIYSSKSDVIISYQKMDNSLYVRYQRDRYSIEIPLSTENLGELKQAGMMEGNRYGWAFTDSHKYKR